MTKTARSLPGSACILLAAFLLMACDGEAWIIADLPPATPSEIPPFIITKPAVEINEHVNYFTYAGIVFKFLNNHREHVDNITLSFMLFDTKTQVSPFIGANRFEITKWDFVSPGENKEILVSLDPYIYNAPREPYQIDFFFFLEIHYIDGRVWPDTFGKYRVRF
jgi:hypothetical protein